MYQVELCDAFVRISQGVWRWMRRAQRVRSPSLAKRASKWPMHLRETTLTDYVVLRLLEECSPAVSVFTFPALLEAQTGADMELWITDSRHRWLGLRVQCKVLSPDGKFRELHYKRNGRYQSDYLIQSAQRSSSCLPIYLLYVGPYAHRLRFWGCPCQYWGFPPRSICCRPWGNWWLSAYRVPSLRPNNDLAALAQHMTPWHCMVCWPRPDIPESLNVRNIYARLRVTVFDGEKEFIGDVGEPQAPPHYVALAREGELPEAAEALRELLEGREMQHLVILDLGQLEG